MSADRSNEAQQRLDQAIEAALDILDAIANKKRQLVDVIEPIRTINDAAKLAKYAHGRLHQALLVHEHAVEQAQRIAALATQPAQPAPSQPVGASEAVGQALRLARRALYELIACDQHQLEAKNHALAAIDGALSAPQPAAQPQAVEDAEFEVLLIYGHGEIAQVAGASGPSALAEAMNYARQYVEEGPVEVYEVKRTLVAKLNAARTAAAGGKEGA